MSIATEITAWAAPVLAGALIGFITNVLAIKMLFRPLEPRYLFKWRLPFTPGILPRNRKNLAISIGNMVERELITPEIVRERLGRDDVRQGLLKVIQNALSDNKGVVSSAVVKVLDRNWPEIRKGLLTFLNTDSVHKRLEAAGQALITDAIAQFNVYQRFFLGIGQFDEKLRAQMPEIIDSLIDKIDQFAADSEVKAKFLVFTGNTVSKAAANSADSAAAITDKLLAEASANAEHIPAAVDIAALVRDRIDSLEMEKVERIVLDVMANQLKWIDIFGGILGGLIGLFQAALSFFLYR
jgi:uncharacterized membrane protein YheB (UPF0754 family)